MFASDRVGTPGVLGDALPVGTEGAGHHLLGHHVDVSQIGKQARFRAQVPVLRLPREPIHEDAPASVPNSGRAAPRRVFGGLIAKVRENLATREESLTRVLTGSPFNRAVDPEQRGTMMEPAGHVLGFLDVGPNHEVTTSHDVTPQSVINEAADPHNDITQQLQDPHGEEFWALRSFRANFPYVPVHPLPVCRTLFLNTTATAYDMAIPDGAVLVSAAYAGTALCYISFDAQATIPSITQTANNQNTNDGQYLLVPYSRTPFFYIKGKRAISGIANALASHINFAFYMNN